MGKKMTTCDIVECIEPEGTCNRQGCHDPGEEYVLLPGGAVHLCRLHYNELKMDNTALVAKEEKKG